jgi:hypothetical protein
MAPNWALRPRILRGPVETGGCTSSIIWPYSIWSDCTGCSICKNLFQASVWLMSDSDCKQGRRILCSGEAVKMCSTCMWGGNVIGLNVSTWLRNHCFFPFPVLNERRFCPCKWDKRLSTQVTSHNAWNRCQILIYSGHMQPKLDKTCCESLILGFSNWPGS